MERLTEKITDKRTGEILAYRVKCQKDVEAVQKLGRLEDLEEQGKLLELPCAVGDTVYYRYDGIKIAPMRIEKIIIAEYGINLLLEYCGNDEKLKYWEINIESTAIDCKIIFLTIEEAESALKELKSRESRK